MSAADIDRMMAVIEAQQAQIDAMRAELNALKSERTAAGAGAGPRRGRRDADSGRPGRRPRADEDDRTEAQMVAEGFTWGTRAAAR